MNDSAKPADTPVADLELKIDLEIEELEKIVAPDAGLTTIKSGVPTGD
jgi:hypothetical protein